MMHTVQKNLILAKILVWDDKGIIRNFAVFNSPIGQDLNFKSVGKKYNFKWRIRLISSYQIYFESVKDYWILNTCKVISQNFIEKLPR